MPPVPVLDSHVHLWDPAELSYPWLEELPRLRRRFDAEALSAATPGVPLQECIFVECNCTGEKAFAEAQLVARLAESDRRIIGIVAFADLTRPDELPDLLDAYEALGRVCGIRHNIQGHAAGFATSHAFVAGVREVGRRGLTFDLCATHDQLAEVVVLAGRCPETRLVLDHCGKPDIAGRRLDPWREHIRQLADLPHVWCKLSGLLTETAADGWTEEDLLPYADQVADRFSPDRLMYGGDWPVVTLAGTYLEWYQFTRRFTGEWSAEDRAAFYRGNARRFYGL